MNRWYVAAILVLLVAIAVAVFMPAIPGCPTGINECGGFEIAPATVVFVGALVAGAIGFIGFVRAR